MASSAEAYAEMEVVPGNAAAASQAAIELKGVELDLPLDKRVFGFVFRPSVEAPPGSRIHVTRRGSFVRALSEIDLKIGPGERVGLVGVNGAGKSTLLRVMAEIYEPTRGRCAVRGRVSTLFSSAVGVNQNASGRENIFLSARTLGMSRAKIAEMEEDIVAFADIGEFIDLPLYTYSSGMRTRLGFAIATALEPEILLVDEVFGVGDAEFRRKAEARIAHILRRAGVLVIATHNDRIVREFCSHVCLLSEGKVAFYGPVEEGLALYAAGKAPKPKAIPSAAPAAKSEAPAPAKPDDEPETKPAAKPQHAADAKPAPAKPAQ